MELLNFTECFVSLVSKVNAKILDSIDGKGNCESPDDKSKTNFYRSKYHRFSQMEIPANFCLCEGKVLNFFQYFSSFHSFVDRYRTIFNFSVIWLLFFANLSLSNFADIQYFLLQTFPWGVAQQFYRSFSFRACQLFFSRAILVVDSDFGCWVFFIFVWN